MSNIVEGLISLFIIAPCVIVVFCFAPRYLLLCEIGKVFHIRNPKVKLTSIWQWIMLTYYRDKAKNKGVHLRTYILYISSLGLANLVALLIVVGTFGDLQRIDAFRHIIDVAYSLLCFFNISSFLLLRTKYKT